MKCRFCGKKIKRGEATCRKCGREVTEELKTDEIIEAMPELHDEFDNITKMQAKEKKKSEKKLKRAERKTTRIVVAIVLVIAILLGVAGGILYHKKKAEEAAKEQHQIVTTSAVDSVIKRSFVSESFNDITVTDENSAMDVISAVKESFGILDVNSEFRLEKEIKIGNGTVYRFKQVYSGIDVYGGVMVVMADNAGCVVGLNGVYIPTNGLSTEYKIDIGSASAAITEYVNSLGDYAVVKGTNITEIKKAVCNTEGKSYLTYTANVSGYNNLSKYMAYDIFVDAFSGQGVCISVTSSFENESVITSDDIENSYIYEMATANDKFNWNDEKMELAEEPLNINEITAGNASMYVAGVKNAVDSAYHYFNRAFNWKGLNGKGDTFKVYINSNEYVEEDLPTERAMYTNGKLMFFREDLTQGDIDYNTVVHEYAHGVMHNIVGFRGTMELTENSAIAEGLADVFSELAEATKNGIAPDWLHGERNLITPQEGYYTAVPDNISIESLDACYKHSTIVSHLAANIEQQFDNISLQNEFWFKVMCFMTQNTDFGELNSIINAVANNMYKEGKLNSVQHIIIAESVKQTDVIRGEINNSVA